MNLLPLALLAPDAWVPTADLLITMSSFCGGAKDVPSVVLCLQHRSRLAATDEEPAGSIINNPFSPVFLCHPSSSFISTRASILASCQLPFIPQPVACLSS